MYRIRKTFKFPFGHRLSKHEGLCKNFHGHNAKLEVQLMSLDLNENDMVIDFSELKKVVNELIIKDFDHSMVLNDSDKEKINGKKIYLNGDPTAEVLSEHFYKILDEYFKVNNGDIQVEFVRLWENDGAFSEYSEED